MTDRLPLQIQKAVRRYRPIQAAGLTLYPIKVKDLDQFQLAKPALEALQQSFPVRLMSMPILQAFYQLDHEAAVEAYASALKIEQNETASFNLGSLDCFPALCWGLRSHCG